MDFSYHLSSNCKVLHYLTSKSMCTYPETVSSNEYLSLKDQIRFRAGSDGDSSTRSDCSPAQSLSDPNADSSPDSSNNSILEELDFNLAFDQITSDDDDDDDDDNENEQTTTAMDDVDTILNDDFLRQSSQMTLIDDNDRDSTFTLCADDHFSDYSDDSSRHILRSNSIDILQWDNKADLVEKPSKKAVRFADMLGLDLESVRYMTPPDPSSNSLTDDNIRLKLEQIRLSRSLTLINGYSYASISKQYNLVSKNFTPPKNIIPIIYEQRVLLECLYTKDSTVYGTIRVHNFVYDKRVFVRLTKDEWNSHTDIQAWHSMNYDHDHTDVFTFQISLPKSHDANDVPKRLLFALCLQAMTDEYWDNNQSQNYILDVYEKR